jgi:hypothetical protein
VSSSDSNEVKKKQIKNKNKNKKTKECYGSTRKELHTYRSVIVKTETGFFFISKAWALISILPSEKNRAFFVCFSHTLKKFVVRQ